MSDLLHPRLSDCRRIFLREYAVPMMIGAHDFEKGAPQRVIFNVDVFVPIAATTPKQDELVEVLDYDTLRETIRMIASRGHIHLQETLCDAIAESLLGQPNVRAVRVSTAKPDVYPDCDRVGLELFRFRD